MFINDKKRALEWIQFMLLYKCTFDLCAWCDEQPESMKRIYTHYQLIYSSLSSTHVCSRQIQQRHQSHNNVLRATSSVVDEAIYPAARAQRNRLAAESDFASKKWRRVHSKVNRTRLIEAGNRSLSRVRFFAEITYRVQSKQIKHLLSAGQS